jgi:hypothetical protein
LNSTNYEASHVIFSSLILLLSLISKCYPQQTVLKHVILTI